MSPDRDAFDELAAARRFPAEHEWLSLELPADLDELAPPAAFADRVLERLRDERELDDRLDELDRALPRELLAQFTPPPPSPSFVATTSARIAADRRQRWQQMLARYVAPEPSPAFVSRTLAALRDHGGRAGHDPASPAPLHRSAVYGLLAAAAALLLWFALADTREPDLLERLADRAPASLAWSESTTPMAAILARMASDEEPHALFDQPADDLWLLAEGGGELR